MGPTFFGGSVNYLQKVINNSNLKNSHMPQKNSTCAPPRDICLYIQKLTYIYILYTYIHVYLLNLFSSFHRALLQSITFISRLMHLIIQNLEVKIYVYKSLKDTKLKLKITPTCFGSYAIHHQGV